MDIIGEILAKYIAIGVAAAAAFVIATAPHSTVNSSR
jgi:hypothetical protein